MPYHGQSEPDALRQLCHVCGHWRSRAPIGPGELPTPPARKCAIRDGILLHIGDAVFPPSPWCEHDRERRHVAGSPNVGRRREASQRAQRREFAHRVRSPAPERCRTAPHRAHPPMSEMCCSARPCSRLFAGITRCQGTKDVNRLAELRPHRTSERANQSPSVETGTSPCLHLKSRCWPSRLRRSALP